MSIIEVTVPVLPESVSEATLMTWHKKVGEAIQEGDALLTIYSNTEDIEEVKALLYQYIEIGETGEEPPLIHEIITE